jgi:outer membrane lipoprotein-sorting protein
MNEFKFSCPHCDQHILMPDGYEGVQINCPACQKLIVVPPTPGAVKPPAPPAALGIQRPAAPAASSAAAPVAARTAYNPPPPQKTGSSAMKTALVISAVIVALAVLGGGGWCGWHFYSNHKAKVEAAKGNPAAQVPAPSVAQSAGALDVLTKVHQAYTNLASLSVEGTSVMVIDLSGVTAADMNPNQSAAQKKAAEKKTARRPANLPKAMTNTTEVAIKLSRPDLYRIEGITKMAAGRMTMTNTVAAWSSGATNYTLMIVGGGMYKNFTTAADRKSAIMMTAQSGGLVMAIPQLFFDEGDDMGKFIKDLGQTDDDDVDGEDCYTLTGKMMGQKLKIWVSKASYMILQSQITLGGAVSDADIDTAFDTFNTKTNMTPAQLDKMRAQAKQQAAMMTKIRGVITETYDTIETNKTFTADNFNYPVPPGVKLSPTAF